MSSLPPAYSCENSYGGLMAERDRAANHVSSAELNRFLFGEMSGAEAAPVVAHLLTGCRRCREEMSALASVVFAKGELPAGMPTL
jgi:hypothetical protein